MLVLKSLPDKHSPRPLLPRPLSPRLLSPRPLPLPLTASKVPWECLRLLRATLGQRSIRTPPRMPEVSRSASPLQTTPNISLYDLCRRYCCGCRHLHPHLRDNKHLGQCTRRNRLTLQLLARFGRHQHRCAQGQRRFPTLDPSAQMVRHCVGC